MTIHIDGTFLNGVLFGVYAMGVVCMVYAGIRDKSENKPGPLQLLLTSILWPLLIPCGMILKFIL